MGEAARSALAAVDVSGIEHAAVVVNRTYSRQDHPHDRSEGPYDLDTAIAVVNADQVQMFSGAVGPGFFAGRKTVGFWSWLEQFPEKMVSAAAPFDEIWANSTFAAVAVREQIERPVHVFPLSVGRPEPAGGSIPREVAHQGFVFLFMFDYLSVFERKNPLAVIEAYSKAFTPSDGTVLVVKSVNGDLRRLDPRSGWPPLIDLTSSSSTTTSPRAIVMHSWRGPMPTFPYRPEGFGLTMAEAMIMGKPVIATGYSGNLDFMTEENSFLVPFEMSAVPSDCDPYPPGIPWAEPDVDAAARLMRQVVDEPGLAARKATLAIADITRTHGLPVAAEFVRQRFDALAALHLEQLRPPRARPSRSRLTLPRRLIGGASRRLVGNIERLGNPR